MTINIGSYLVSVLKIRCEINLSNGVNSGPVFCIL